MAYSFNTSVGTISQIRTIASLLGFISALGMSMLSIKYPCRSLLLSGLILIILSALGTALSGSLFLLFIIYPINGLASNMVLPSINTLVGEIYPTENRARIMGWIGSSGGLSYMIGSIAIVTLASRWGWRSAFILYVGLIPIIALVAVWLFITESDSQSFEVGLLDGFRAISSDRSAYSILLASLLIGAASQSLYFYSFTFIRESFNLNQYVASYIFSAASLSFLIGSFICGYVVEFLDLKKTCILSLLLALVATFFYPISSPFVSIFLILAGHLFFALQCSATNTLILEQLPNFRGSMMSLSASVSYLGYSLGTFIGGTLLIISGWSMFSTVFGFLALSSLMIIYFFVRNPANI